MNCPQSFAGTSLSNQFLKSIDSNVVLACICSVVDKHSDSFEIALLRAYTIVH